MISKKLKPQLKPNTYDNKLILAPMVRENSLPFRLLCLKYGADIVYTEELIDYRLSACRRLDNQLLGTVDFVDDRGEVVFRTCEAEAGKVVLQLGSNDPDRALKAAKLVEKDVLGLDFNFGCPKSFSLSGGMGAALLDRPEQIEALLKNAVENLDIHVTCKIRILPDAQATLKLVKMIESCGVSAIAVHGRTKSQRPHHQNDNELIKLIAQSVTVPVIANGGSNIIKSYDDILKFKDLTGTSSVMVARAAMKNPSIFDKTKICPPVGDVIREFLKLCVRYNNYIATTKYAVQAMMAGQKYGGDFVHNFHAAHDFKTLCDLFNLAQWYESNSHLLVEQNSNSCYTQDIDDSELRFMIEEKKQQLAGGGEDFIIRNVPYAPKVYGPVAPKGQLINYINKNIAAGTNVDEKPAFDTFKFGKHKYYSIVRYNNKFYLNKSFSNGKKVAEHATALLICDELGLVDFANYMQRSTGNNRNVD